MAAHDRPLDQAPADWLRPSSWIIALGVGLGAAFGSLPGPLGVALARGVEWFGWSLAGIFLLPALLWLGHRAVDFSDRLREYRHGPEVEPVDDEPQPLVSPLVAGGLLTDLERHVQDGLLLTLRHGQAAGTLRSTRLIGLGFVDYDHWAYWVNILAAHGYAEKQNGVPTELAKGKTWTWARRQVVNGMFDAPELPAGDPLPRLPHPFRASAYVEVELA